MNTAENAATGDRSIDWSMEVEQMLDYLGFVSTELEAEPTDRGMVELKPLTAKTMSWMLTDVVRFVSGVRRALNEGKEVLL